MRGTSMGTLATVFFSCDTFAGQSLDGDRVFRNQASQRRQVPAGSERQFEQVVG